MITQQNDTIHVCFGLISITSEWSYGTAIVTTIINIIFSVVATVSNLTILVVLAVNKRLRSPPYLLLGGLCFSDLLVGLVIQPMAVMQRLNEINSRVNCDFTLVFRYFQWLANSVSMFLINLVTIDRYYAIRYPFRYPDFATSRRYMVFMILVWLSCASMLLVPYIWRSLQLFNMVFILIVIAVTVVLSLFCYLKIYKVILEQGRKITHTTLGRDNDNTCTEQQDTRISNRAIDGNLIEADEDGAQRRWPDTEIIIQENSSKGSETGSGNGTGSMSKSNLQHAGDKVKGEESDYCKQVDNQSDISYSVQRNRARLEAIGKRRPGHENHYVHEPTKHMTRNSHKNGSKKMTGDEAPFCDHLTVLGSGKQQGYMGRCRKENINNITAARIHTLSLPTASGGFMKRKSMVCWLEVTNEQGVGPDRGSLAVNVRGEGMCASDYPSKSDDGIFLAGPQVGSRSHNSSKVKTNSENQTTVESVQSRKQISRTMSNINLRLIKRLRVSSTKRETKKTYTVILLFLTIFFSYMPLFIMSLAVGRYSRYTYSAFTWGETVAFLSSSVNPVIYCFRMKDIRNAVKDLIRRCFKCSMCLE